MTGQSEDAGVVATYPNPCEIDVNFGTVATEQYIAATIEIENVGYGALDLSPFIPNLAPEFSLLNYGNPPAIAAGGFDAFTVTFWPFKAGQVQSAFAIQTDGENPQCPAPGDESSGNAVTVQLKGAAASVDAGS